MKTSHIIYIGALILIGIIGLVWLFFFSITPSSPEKPNTWEGEIEALQKPVKVYAEKQPSVNASRENGEYGAIILKDANGKLLTIDGEYSTAAALLSTYKVGDTLK